MAIVGEVDAKKHKRIQEYEDTHVEWRIARFISIGGYDKIGGYSIYHDSPTFSVQGVPFCFRMFPRSLLSPEFAVIHLKSDMKREFSVEYNFGLKMLDGSVKQLTGGIMKGEDTFSEEYACLIISKMTEQKSELMLNGVLTVTCTLKSSILHSSETCMFDKPKEMKLIRLEKLSENFEQLFGDKETCDVTLKVKDKEYKAHKCVLIARSSVFAATFKHDTLERQTGVITIPDCDPDSFQEFLEYLYSGKLDKLSYPSAINLYYTSDKYDIEELKSFCLEHLMQCLTVENVSEVVIFADKYDLTKLLAAVQEFFNKNLCKIFETSEWYCLMKNNTRLADKLLKEMSKAKV